MAEKPRKAGKAGKPNVKSRRAPRRAAPAQQHPGEVLREILADTPPALAAKWFGLSPAELEGVLQRAGCRSRPPWPKRRAASSARAQRPGST